MDSSDDKSPLEAFLAQYWKDRESKAVASLDHYLQAFPGDAAGIAREFLSLESPTFDSEGSEVRVSVTEHAGVPKLRRLADYEIVSELGRGGFGVVYRAWDTRLDRAVALKVLQGLGPEREDVLKRFKREAEVAGRLEHPGIARVYEAGFEGSVPFIAMELVRGTSLDRLIRRAQTGRVPSGGFLSTDRGDDLATKQEFSSTQSPRDETTRVARLIERIARALHVAHEAGVIHRDVKPANVIVRPDGQPVLLDFGLARREMGELHALTATGGIMGTPAYMSPEQTEGRQVDRRTDVWSLGVILYECLTLRRPFAGPSHASLFYQIREVEPPAIRDANPAASSDLAAIVLAAISKDARRRYETTLQLAEDLRRVREGRPVSVAMPGRLSLLVRWARRNRGLATAIASAALILVVGIAVSTSLAFVAERRAQEADRNLALWERLADARTLDELIAEADNDLWPAVPSRIGAMTQWLDRARALAERRELHRETLFQLRANALPYDATTRDEDLAATAEDRARLREIEEQLKGNQGDDDATQHRERRGFMSLERVPPRDELLRERKQVTERIEHHRTWKFASDAERLRHDRLRNLVADLDRFTGPGGWSTNTIQGVAARKELAGRNSRHLEDTSSWARCIEDVGRKDGRYRGLTISPMPGLVPLGLDEESGLWEFWHVASGDRPEWVGEPLGPGKTGFTGNEGREGLVMVLLPGGAFTMGAQRIEWGLSPTAGNIDRTAGSDENPVHQVLLSPFLVSKYEVTQSQWTRVWGKNLSSLRAGSRIVGRPYAKSSQKGLPETGITNRNPATNMAWAQARQACARWGLSLPSESQWEYACRGGTRTRWHTGNNLLRLDGFANLADSESSAFFSSGQYFDLPDGYVYHAPVGHYRPNPFGLHDVHGNVNEWCLDQYGPYDNRTAMRGNGLRGPLLGTKARVIRGGSFRDVPRNLRSALRRRATTTGHSLVGFRPVAAIPRTDGGASSPPTPDSPSKQPEPSSPTAMNVEVAPLSDELLRDVVVLLTFEPDTTEVLSQDDGEARFVRIRDLSGHDNDATVTVTGVTTGPGKAGTALFLSAQFGAVSVDHADSLELDSFTVSLWMKAHRTVMGHLIGKPIGRDHLDSIILQPMVQGLSFRCMDSRSAWSPKLGARWDGDPKRDWQHIVAVKNGTTASLYLNGTRVASRNDWPARVAYDGNPLWIGGDDNNGDGVPDGLFLGYIDEFAIWSRGLTESEIAHIHRAGVQGQRLR